MVFDMEEKRNKKLVLTEDSPKEQYEELYKLKVGEVFKIKSGYETVMRRISEYVPEGNTFKVFPINPGTALYTMCGSDHCVVTETTMS